MVSATKLQKKIKITIICPKKKFYLIKITIFANINPQNDLKKKDLYGLKHHLTCVQC